jgi:hypothetical protein
MGMQARLSCAAAAVLAAVLTSSATLSARAAVHGSGRAERATVAAAAVERELVALRSALPVRVSAARVSRAAATATCDGAVATIVGTEAGDTLQGTPGDDVIAAGGGDDVVDGGGGDDLICGDDGNDTLKGGVGNDVLDGGAGDTDLLSGGPGDDQLQGGAGTLDAAFFGAAPGAVDADLRTGTATGEGADSLAGIESLVGSGFGDRLTGNDGVNALFGLGGNDQLDGRGGTDLVGFLAPSGPTGVVATLTSAMGEGTDSLRNDEGLVGSRLADVLIGDERPNILIGQEGNDRLRGGRGSDMLYGGPGRDVLEGGGDADKLDGGADADVLDGGTSPMLDEAAYEDAPGPVTVDLARRRASGSAGNDVLRHIENVSGSPFADVLRGDGRANVLNGGDGNDRIVGGGGRDLLFGGLGKNRLDGGAGRDACISAGVRSHCERIARHPRRQARKTRPPLRHASGISRASSSARGALARLETPAALWELAGRSPAARASSAANCPGAGEAEEWRSGTGALPANWGGCPGWWGGEITASCRHFMGTNRWEMMVWLPNVRAVPPLEQQRVSANLFVQYWNGSDWIDWNTRSFATVAAFINSAAYAYGGGMFWRSAAHPALIKQLSVFNDPQDWIELTPGWQYRVVQVLRWHTGTGAVQGWVALVMGHSFVQWRSGVGDFEGWNTGGYCDTSSVYPGS